MSPLFASKNRPPAGGTPPGVLVLTRNLPPLVGGMERLNWHLIEELSRHAAVAAVVPRGARHGLPVSGPVREVPLSPLPIFLATAFAAALELAIRVRPRWIIAGSGLLAPVALAAARVAGATALVYVHGLDVAVQHPIYRLIWWRALRRMDRVIANSSATANLARTIGVSAGRLEILHPGVAMPAVEPDAAAIAVLRNELGLGNGPLLLSVGRLTTRKGLREFIREVLPRVVKVRPDVTLVVVGDVPRQALKAEAQTPESLRAAADEAGVARHVVLVGTITDRSRLGALYAAAALHVFPVRELPGDPEGFGMVAVEAAAYGLATIAYDCGGVGDAIAPKRSGILVPEGNAEAFANSVLAALSNPLSANLSKAHAAAYAWPAFGRKLFDIVTKATRL